MASLLLLLLFCYLGILCLRYYNSGPVSVWGSSPCAGCIRKEPWPGMPEPALRELGSRHYDCPLSGPDFYSMTFGFWVLAGPASSNIWCPSLTHQQLVHGTTAGLTAVKTAWRLSSGWSPFHTNTIFSLVPRTGREKPRGYWAMAPVALWWPVPAIPL